MAQDLDSSFATRRPMRVGVGLPRQVVDRPEVTIQINIWNIFLLVLRKYLVACA